MCCKGLSDGAHPMPRALTVRPRCPQTLVRFAEPAQAFAAAKALHGRPLPPSSRWKESARSPAPAMRLARSLNVKPARSRTLANCLGCQDARQGAYSPLHSVCRGQVRRQAGVCAIRKGGRVRSALGRREYLDQSVGDILNSEALGAGRMGSGRGRIMLP